MTLRRFEFWVVALATVLVPVAFLRVVRDSFDVTKSVLVTMAGIALAPYAIFEASKYFRRRRMSLLGVSTLLFVVTSILTLIVSRNRWGSFFGQYQRYTGLLTILSCVAIAVVVATRISRAQIRTLATILVSVQAVVNLYGWMQATNRDPWEWTSQSFGRLVFSTLGNPNTASAFSVITLPLSVWAISQVRRSRATAVVGALTYSSTIYLIPIYASFQAYVGLVLVVAALGLLLRTWSFRLGAYLVVGLLIAQIWFFFSVSESSLVLFVLLLGTAVAVVVLGREELQIEVLCRTWRPNVLRLSLITGAGLGAIIIVFFNRIQSEIEGGLLERKYFYRAAFDLWTEAPILGRGLETFGSLYTQYRPAAHATTLEYSITSSVHSIPLGMFASGGVILGLSFLFLIVVVAWFGFQQARLRRDDLDDLRPWFVVSFLAFLTISLVSVESIHLFFLASLVMGAVVHSTSNAADVASSGSGRSRRPKKSTGASNYLPLISLVLLLATLPVSTRFFRADKASIEGMKVAAIQDVEGAKQSFKRAREIAPWEGAFAVQYAQVLAASGDPQGAAAEALKAVELANYVGGATLEMALIVLQSGQLEAGLQILETAISRDPFAPQLKRSAADLFKQVADVEESEGLVEQAEVHRARANELLAAAGAP